MKHHHKNHLLFISISQKVIDSEGEKSRTFDERIRYNEHAEWVNPNNTSHIDLTHFLVVPSKNW